MKKLSSFLLIAILIMTVMTGCDIPAITSSQTQNESIAESTLESFSESRITDSSLESITDSLEIFTSQSKLAEDDITVGNLLTVSYIDVGQADSILIQSPNGKNMLIDAGESTTQTTVSNYLKSKGVKKIDVLVATHPHADHIGGMAYIINNFEIGSIYTPKATTTTQTFEDLLTTIKNKGLSINTAKAGIEISFDESLKVNMIAPVGTSYSDLNSYSAVIKIVYKSNSFLFTGDATSVSEQEILDSGVDIKADVLKVGHHGSATSTSAAFLIAVSPKYAVISVGKGNSYGHPAQVTLDRLHACGAQIYRTDDGGTVIVTSDGQNITLNRNASTYTSQAPPPTITPTATVAPTQIVASTAEDIIVYKTATGSKYHLDGCSYLSKSKIPIKLSEAKAEGLTPCSRCNPPK